MSEPSNEAHTFSLVVGDRPGVLVRIALVFARRGFNIESLAVSPGVVGGFARMTLTSRGHADAREQIIRQLAKLIDVVFVTHHSGDNPVIVEIALIKLQCDAARGPALRALVDEHGGHVMDSSDATLVVQIAGVPEGIDRFLEAVAPCPVQELVRSGPIVMDRGTSRFADLARQYG